MSMVVGSKRIGELVHDYKQLCTRISGKLKCFLKAINTFHLITQVIIILVSNLLLLCSISCTKDTRKEIIMRIIVKNILTKCQSLNCVDTFDYLHRKSFVIISGHA